MLKKFALIRCACIVVTLQLHAHVHIFCEGIVNMYTKFGKDRFIIPRCWMKNHDNGKDVPKSDIRANIQFLTLENVSGYKIHSSLCANQQLCVGWRVLNRVGKWNDKTSIFAFRLQFSKLKILLLAFSFSLVSHKSYASYVFKKLGFLWRYSHYSYIGSAT